MEKRARRELIAIEEGVLLLLLLLLLLQSQLQIFRGIHDWGFASPIIKSDHKL